MIRIIITFTLFIFSFSFALTTTKCPSDFTVDKTLNGCEEVCNEVFGNGKLGDSGYQLKGYIGHNDFGVSGGITYMPEANVCSCLFSMPPEADEVIPAYVYCTYRVEHKNLVANKVSLTNEDVFGAKDIPTNLVKLFIFDKSASSIGSASANIIFSGLYTVYTSAIKGFSVAFALALTIIITGWTFGTYFFTNFLDVLRQRQGHLEFSISSDLKRKAQMVLLASLVFLVPVNTTSSPIMKAAGVGQSDAAKNILSANKCEDAQEIKLPVDCENIDLTQTNTCTACQDYLDKIQKNCQIILQAKREEDSSNNNNNEEGSKGMSADTQTRHLQNQNNLLAQSYNMCIKDMSKDKEKDYPNWLKSDSIEKSINATYLPSAVAIVKSFISTGISFAQSVGSYATNVIQTYTMKKLSKGDTYKALGIPSIDDQKQQVKEMFEEMKKKEKLVFSGDCFSNIGNSCADFNALPDEEKQKIKQKPTCTAAIEMAEEYCKKYNPVYLTSKASSLEKSLNSTEDYDTNLYNQTTEAFNNIKSSMGWLSPAVIPLSSIYIQVAKLSGVQKIEAHTDIKLIDGSKTENLWDFGKSAVRGVVDKFEGGVDTVVETFKPLINTGKESVEVGWDALVEGKYGSRMYVLGRMIGITSIPPGSMIKEKFGSFIGKVKNGIIATLLVPLGVFGGNIGAIVGIGGSMALNLASDVLTLLLSAVLTAMILAAIPLLAVAIVSIFRFIAYLKDLIKFMLSIPFFAVAAATRDSGGVFEAFRELIKLTLTPAVLAFAPLVGFAAVELTFFFGYDLPMAILESAISAFMGSSPLFLFLVGYITAMLYVIITVLSALVGWEITTTFIDSITEFIQRLAGATSTSSSRAISGAISILRPRLPQ